MKDINHSIDIVVCGAHMSGLVLNTQLTERGAVFAEHVHTANCYQLYALPGGPPFRPGLIRVNEGTGSSIEAEIWRLPASQWGDFIAQIPSPLGIGTIQLSDGRSVKGFICEGIAVHGAKNISALGSWRNFLKTL